MISGKNSVFVEAVFGSLRQIIGYLLTFPVCRPDRTGLIASTLLRAACRELFRVPAFVCGLFGLPEPAFGSGGRPSRPRAFSNSVARAGSFHPVVFPSGETSEGKFCGDDSFRPLTGGRLRYRPFRRYGAFPRLVFCREAACRCRRNNPVVWQRRSRNARPISRPRCEL